MRWCHALDVQHRLDDLSNLLVRHFRQANLCEPAFHLIHGGNIGFAKVKEFAIAAADDRQEFLFKRVARFAHENDDLLPVKCLGRCFSHVEFFIRPGALHPGFQRNSDSIERRADEVLVKFQV